MSPEPPSYYIEEHSVRVRLLACPDELGERDAARLIEQGLREVRNFGLNAAGVRWEEIMAMFEREGWEITLPHVPRRSGFLGLGKVAP